MSTFKNVLLTTDFSASADAAIPYAADLARKFGGTIRLLYVFEDSALITGLPGEPVMTMDWVASARTEREARLALLAEKIRKDESVECVPCLREGMGAAEIVKAAKELKSDCIVIATHGRTGFSHLMFGSVAEKVVRLSHCPVLTIRPKLA
jgi:nucleotide-binding universal stress UspA family protein